MTGLRYSLAYVADPQLLERMETFLRLWNALNLYTVRKLGRETLTHSIILGKSN